MMRTSPVVLLLAVVVAVSQFALAQDKPFDGTDLQALRTAVKTDKKALVASTIKLTDAEAKKFWPLYGAYQLKLDTLNRRKARAFEDLVSRDKPITDAQAKGLLAESLAIDDEETKAMRAYQNRLNRALPPRKVARYLQLENKIRTVQDYDIAGALPLIN
jgi:Spy/CpxP family protein refolding chaperone